MSTEESTWILNCLKSKNENADWGADAAVADYNDKEKQIPESKDLRESWWEIGNQGSTGSCVGWAAADSVLRWHFVKAGKINNNDKLSVRQIWMSSKETDVFVSRPTTFIEAAGTSIKTALDVARRYGCVLDSMLPFGSGKLYSGKTDKFYATAARLRIASYFNLGNNLATWRRWLALCGPILTRLNVDKTWYESKNNKGNMDTYVKIDDKMRGHAVALVGYTKDRFIVRNSWGTRDWGDEGFGYATDQYAKIAFTEAYGVEV